MKKYLDLLPPSHHRMAILRHRLGQWIAVLAVTVVVAGVLVTVEHRRVGAQLVRLSAVESAYKPLVHMRDEIQRMRIELNEVQVREALALKLSDERPTLTALGIVSRAARQCEGSISVRQLTLSERLGDKSTAAKSTAAKSGTGDKRGQPTKVLTLQGQGLDNLSVARFVASLREVGVFDRVELKSSGSEAENASASTVNRRYLIECTF